MPVFAWEGRTRQGQLKKGVVEAATEAAAMMQLRAQAIIPVSVQAEGGAQRAWLQSLQEGREDARAGRCSPASSPR